MPVIVRAGRVARTGEVRGVTVVYAKEEAEAREPAAKLKVLLSTAGPDGTTKFVDQIVTFAPSTVEFLYFSWRTALFSRYDVLHVHWPEAMVRGRNAVVRGGRSVLGALLLARLSLLRVPVVRTLHNLKPHEPGPRYEKVFTDALEARTCVVVRLNNATPRWTGAVDRLILHGDYVKPFAQYESRTTVPGRVVYFGRVQPYKGISNLIVAFRKLDDDGATLRIVGKSDPKERVEIAEMISADPRISTDLRFVSDAELVSEVSSGELAVFPYDEMHNSGALLVALSLGTPALAPRSPSNELLQEEVGDAWLRLYEGKFSSGHLKDAVEWARTTARGELPSFDPSRDWGAVAQAYRSDYDEAVNVRRKGRSK